MNSIQTTYITPRLIFAGILVAIAFLPASTCNNADDCAPNSPEKHCKLSIQSVFQCDNFTDGRCVEKKENESPYHTKMSSKSLLSWRDFSNYMYFYTKETPGVRVVFNRKLNKKERKLLERSLKCSYRIERNNRFEESHMEGRRIDKDGSGFWCFDYLGSFLYDYHRKYKSLDVLPQKNFFPIILKMEYTSDLKAAQGELRVKTHLIWTRKQD